ncbi:MAG: serpin family protein, partial [Planctomycetota bacterium]
MNKKAIVASVLLAIGFLALSVCPAHARENENVAEVVEGNTEFAVDFYKQVGKRGGNMFFSPYSISSALAMTCAGARGETEKEMKGTLHYALARNRLHPAMGALMKDLNTRKVKGRWSGDPNAGKRPFELVVANSLWGQKGFSFEKGFLDLTKKSYEAGLTELDFAKETEKARLTINGWVEKKTKDRIKDLIPEGMLSAAATLVLTNAIYFKAGWVEEFKKFATRNKPFHLPSGETAEVPIMHRGDSFPYYDGDGFQAVSLPYMGRVLSMVLIVPDETDGLADVEKEMTAPALKEWLSAMKHVQAVVGLPKFKMTST